MQERVQEVVGVLAFLDMDKDCDEIEAGKLLRVGSASAGGEETGCSILHLPDGDSLYTEINSTVTHRLACPTNGRKANTQIFGKFIENDSKIRATLNYMGYPDFEEDLGECQFTLHK